MRIFHVNMATSEGKGGGEGGPHILSWEKFKIYIYIYQRIYALLIAMRSNAYKAAAVLIAFIRDEGVTLAGR